MGNLWKPEWDAIAARLVSIVEACELATLVKTYGGVPATLDGQLIATFEAMVAFFLKYQASLPAAVVSRFGDIRASVDALPRGSTMDHVASRLALVTAFRAELDWLLGDPAQRLAATAERAFLHLSRLISADSGVRKTWGDAFDVSLTAETACEQLGAAHLLLHGIYAFKANATGARTDLVLGNQLVWSDSLERAVDGLVLTEWKVARDPKEAPTLAEDARKQAEIYKRGVLAGVELESVRYVVLVSEKAVPNISDVDLNGTIYRHINIAVRPDVPSVQSKKN